MCHFLRSVIFIHLCLKEESAQRKNQMKALDLDRRKHEKLNDLEEEAKEMAEHLLSKANEMRQEQEDEIKHLNEVDKTIISISISDLIIYLLFVADRL